jgi:hypothetical protein
MIKDHFQFVVILNKILLRGDPFSLKNFPFLLGLDIGRKHDKKPKAVLDRISTLLPFSLKTAAINAQPSSG